MSQEYTKKTAKFKITDKEGNVLIIGYPNDIQKKFNVTMSTVYNSYKRGNKLKGNNVEFLGYESVTFKRKEKNNVLKEKDIRERAGTKENYKTSWGQNIILHFYLSGKLSKTTFLPKN